MSKLEELLLTVRKPGRYVGGEWNAVKKEWTPDKVKVLLSFPDLYEVGMSNLGMKILYGILNERDDCLCERAFAPWADFEDVLRKNDIRLFSLESRKPLKEFDIVGFSLTYELTFTNVLNILDLGGIPVRSSERTDEDPLVIAGGPLCSNPEPMADFIDAFLIGEAEEAVAEIVETYKKLWVMGHGSRKKILLELAKIDGVYVPSLYKDERSPAKIKKRVVRDLENAFYPTKQIVPNIQIVHDRIAIEIMRGCKHACKFCQATAVYRPCRERSRKRILQLAKDSYAMTGYDEISLLSLSSVDHSDLRGTIEDLNKEFAKKGVSISVPSLRVEDALIDLPVLISKVKKAGLTFAPETGSEDLRRAMNKSIDMEKLFRAATQSFEAGWKGVKLYFMIGLPGEKESDLLNICELIYKISDLRRATGKGPAHIKASINPFIPKPQTPLEREAMDGMETLESKRDFLRRNMRSRFVELDFHPFKMSYIEAVFSRGDRRLSDVIYGAWQNGARFDGWKELFNFDIWLDSFRKSGLDPALYVNMPRKDDEILPWHFVQI